MVNNKKSTNKEKPVKSISRSDFLKTAAGLTAGFLTAARGWSGSGENAIRGKRSLGGTGLRAMPLGYGATRTLEPALAAAALDNGLDFIDTGRRYFNGKNEEMLGRVLEGHRNEVIIQSKISLRLRETGDALKDAGVAENIYKQMQISLDESLKALRTDWIDILLLHNVSDVSLLSHETVVEFFREAKKAGRIRAFGFSSHRDFIPLIEWNLVHRCYDTMMIPYNHRGGYIHSQSHYAYDWDQPLLESLLANAHQIGIGIVAMKTCSGGPFSESGNAPSYAAALRRVIDRPFIHTTAVAMANENEMQHNLHALAWLEGES
ncbi:MAG TPA: aldo/keto reductase [bacterium]|nr:aldo/keto reductase [bacterium]